MAKNRNDILLGNFDNLKNEANYSDFKDYQKYFIHLCDLQPNLEKERLEIINCEIDYLNKEGFVYIFVIKDKVFKIGESTTSIKDRIQSYNCGKKTYRKNGTCSTTNYFTLQSLLNINTSIEVYAYFPDEVEYIVLGNEIYKGSASPAKVAEGFVIKKFTSIFNKKPIGNIQR
ncbi:MAG: hypothetical protein LBT02_02310 [Rickettsiales bacterium]|jgi:hypothetical protein|nr:hypothetical protein [Rickettsiales bacterium]